AIDLAVGEEPRALPLVAGQAQERRLLPAPGRNSSGAGHDGRPLHEAEDTLRPLPCLSHRAEEFRQLALASPRAQSRACSSRCLDSTTEKELWMPLFSFEGKAPRIHPTAFIAPTASIIGDVTIEENASVWYNAVLRADFGPIVIGRGANVQDGAVVHVTPMHSTEIGAGATVGHSCVIHGATLADEAFVGNGATVLDGAPVG